MFQATISDITLLRDALDTIATLITEGTFDVTDNGFKLIAMDPTSVSMVIFDYLSSAFDAYKVEKPTHMTLNIAYLVQILKRAAANDKISLKLAENRLRIVMEGASRRSFSIPLIDETIKEQKQPDLPHMKCKMQIEPAVMREAVKDASMVSDAVTFEATKTAFKMYTSGDSSDAQMDLTKDNPALITIETHADCKSKYGIDYLEKMIKADKIADTLTIHFGADYPLRLEFKKLDKLHLTFVLAPRVETE